MTRIVNQSNQLCKINNQKNIMKHSKEEIAAKYGEELAQKASETEAQPTSRLIYPANEPEHAEMQEWAGESVNAPNGDTITAYYYFTNKEMEECGNDLSLLDWSNPEFEIQENW